MRTTKMIAAALVGALATSGVALAQDDDPGAELYFEHGCYGCHGFDGKSRMQKLDVAHSAVLSSETGFVAFLRMRAEQNPLLPSTHMPNFPDNALSDDDARAIYAHILRIQSADPEVADIPLFRQMLQDAERAGAEE